MAVCDPFFADYLKEGEIIESTDLTGEIKGIFMRAGKKVLPLMNYPYRMLCYRKGEGKLLFSVNLEESSFGTCYFGVDKGGSHYTLRPGIKVENIDTYCLPRYQRVYLWELENMDINKVVFYHGSVEQNCRITEN
ncbi:MAG TPA: hypothetical protein GXX19_12970 [Syntrophomonadaceae bacterium]|nr:hypothetical protein [Syntrophomonadaceae bacterium]